MALRRPARRAAPAGRAARAGSTSRTAASSPSPAPTGSPGCTRSPRSTSRRCAPGSVGARPRARARTATSSTSCTSSTTATTTWITVEPGTAAALVAYLDRMRFLLRVEVADRSAEYAVVAEPVGRAAPGAPDLRRARGSSAVLERRRRGVADATCRCAPTCSWAARCSCRAPSLLGVRRRDVPAPAPGPGRRCASPPASRGSASTPTTARSRRRSAGCPPPCTWHKGCYRGQETVARVHNLGRPPRRLVQLHLDGSAARTPVAGRPGARSTAARSVGSPRSRCTTSWGRSRSPS